MQLLRNINAKELSGLMSLMACFIFTGFAMYVEPTGEIHDSVIWLVGELLVYSGACFGLDFYDRKHHPKGNNRNQPKKKKE